MNHEKLSELVEGLRDLADWLEAHPDLPVAIREESEVRLDAVTRDDLAAAARAMHGFEKVTDGPLSDWYYTIRKRFGPVSLEVLADRKKVCRKVKRLKEVEEWECDGSLLEPAGEADKQVEELHAQF